MNVIFQLLLATCLVAGLYATGEASSDDNGSDVLDKGYYGMEELPGVDDATIEDEATTTVPRRGQGYKHRHHGSGRNNQRRNRNNRGNWTSEQKIEHICNAIQSPSNLQSRHFEGKMSRLSPEIRATLTTHLAARKEEMTACCQLDVSEKLGCVDNMRKMRYQRICQNEEPMCIWSSIKGQSAERTAQATATKDRCCALQDEERNTCFADVKKNYMRRMRPRSRKF